MSTVEEIQRDIDILQKDISELVKMRAPTCVAYDDLDELYDELEQAKQNEEVRHGSV